MKQLVTTLGGSYAHHVIHFELLAATKTDTAREHVQEISVYFVEVIFTLSDFDINIHVVTSLLGTVDYYADHPHEIKQEYNYRCTQDGND